MNKRIPLTLAAAVLAATATAPAQAELSGNIGVTSNYIWRGMTQTGDEAAVQGGIDWSNDSGFYLGTWVSDANANNSYEWDLYGGYTFKAGDVDLDAGLISYEYPVDNNYFREIYLNGEWRQFNFGVAYTFDSKDDTTAEFSSGDLYLSVGASFEVKPGLGLSITVGNYDFDDAAGDDFTHFQVALSKDDFTFALDKNDRSGVGEDEIRISASWSKSFDL